MTITIASLRAAGLTAEQIVRVLETHETEYNARRREQLRIAQRNWRERNHVINDRITDASKTEKIEQKQSSRNQNNHDRDYSLPFPSPPSMVSPITPSLTPPSSLPLSDSRSNWQKWPSDYREQFWNAYPRKVGKKAVFRKLEAIAKSHEIEFPALLRAVRAIDASEPQFVPHPTTWLNQGRYLDTATAAERKPYQPPNGSGLPTDEQLRAKYANR